MIELKRPLLCFDLETTGTDTNKDRIVEISMIKIMPDGERIIKTKRINPVISIPQGVSDVHGLTNEMLKDEPTFKQLAKGIHEFIQGCDLLTFNGNHFDIPMLYCELERSGIVWDYKGQNFIDVGNMFKRLYPRTLEEAVKLFLGREHDGAHGAEKDTIATIEVFEYFTAEPMHFIDLPIELNELALYSNYDKEIIDLNGCFEIDEDNDFVFSFGKHKGKKAKSEKGYLEWMIKGDFLSDAKMICQSILAKDKKIIDDSQSVNF